MCLECEKGKNLGVEHSSSNCDHLKERACEWDASEEPIPARLWETFDILPNYWRLASDYRGSLQYSLKRNKYLACKWDEFKEQYKKTIFKPFPFPRVKDYHFYNYHNRLLPELTPSNRASFKLTMRKGPGVDARDHLPIPYEKKVPVIKAENFEKKKVKPRDVDTKKKDCKCKPVVILCKLKPVS